MAQYIDKAAVVAEINRVLNSYDPNEITSGRYALVSLRDFLDTLKVKKVKEVDLEKEIELFKGDYEQVDVAWNNDFDYIARHFFELGFNARKQSL